VRCDASGTRFSHARVRRAVLTALRRMSSANRGAWQREPHVARARHRSLPVIRAQRPQASGLRCGSEPRCRHVCVWAPTAAVDGAERCRGEPWPQCRRPLQTPLRRSRAGRGEGVAVVPSRRSRALCARACGHACATHAGWHHADVRPCGRTRVSDAGCHRADVRYAVCVRRRPASSCRAPREPRPLVCARSNPPMSPLRIASVHVIASPSEAGRNMPHMPALCHCVYVLT
jgi:hypothetical protein